jgi:hypothetical protein
MKVPLASGYHEVHQNHKHEGLTFPYPTMGVPIVGKTYNSTKVADKDLAKFDDEINWLFKPYNVSDGILRTPIASSCAMEADNLKWEERVAT